MPPRSYYNSPRASDYIAFAKALFPEFSAQAAEFTERTGLPFLGSLDHLAAYVGVSPSLVRQILHNPEYHYRRFEIPKANGAPRSIETPRTYLKVIHWWINDNILSNINLHESVHGFRPGRSFLTNALAHQGSNHILNMDVEQFFPTITWEMVRNSFLSIGYNDHAAEILATLTTIEGRAPTGAPTSPLIGNIVLTQFDEKCAELALARGLRYTRYADDLTFSSSAWIDDETAEAVRGLLEAEGFRLNNSKTRFMGRGDRMEVTGAVINSDVNLSRSWRNWARGYLYRAVRNPAEYAAQWANISGIYGALHAVDPGHTKAITQLAKRAVDAVRGSS